MGTTEEQDVESPKSELEQKCVESPKSELDQKCRTPRCGGRWQYRVRWPVWSGSTPVDRSSMEWMAGAWRCRRAEVAERWIYGAAADQCDSVRQSDGGSTARRRTSVQCAPCDLRAVRLG